jgi:hypothetical protein
VSIGHEGSEDRLNGFFKPTHPSAIAMFTAHRSDLPRGHGCIHPLGRRGFIKASGANTNYFAVLPRHVREEWMRPHWPNVFLANRGSVAENASSLKFRHVG